MLQFLLGMQFEQRLQSQAAGKSREPADFRRRQTGRDQQDQIRTDGPGLQDLILVDHKILPEDGDIDHLAGYF